MEAHILVGGSIYSVSFCDYTLQLQPCPPSYGNALQVYPASCASSHAGNGSSSRGVASLAVEGDRVTVEAGGQSSEISVEPGFVSLCLWSGQLVVTYNDKVNLHEIHCAAAEMAAVSLLFPSASVLVCTPNVYFNGDSKLLINCTVNVDLGGCMEWYAISSKQLHRACSDPSIVPDKTALLGSCMVTTHVLPACTVGLPGILDCSSVHSVVYGRMAPSALRRTRLRQAPPKQGAVTYAVALTNSARLVCYVDDTPLWDRTLPVVIGSLNVDSVHLQLAASAQSPLLLVSCDAERRLLVLDVLQDGAVLREFTHVGAYILAPLFDPLTEQLMVVPASGAELWGVQAVTHGHVLHPRQAGAAESGNQPPTSTDTSGKKDATTHCTNLGDEVLRNWFVYELPCSPGDSAAGSDGQASCRSVDPHGVWREDSKLVVDAEAYNSVQWRRVVHAVEDGILFRRDVSAATGSGEFVPSGPASEGDTQGGAGTKRPRESDDPSVSAALPLASSQVSRHRDRTALIATLTAQLAKVKADCHQALDLAEQKRASVQFLRSLAVSSAPCPGIKQTGTLQDLPDRAENGEAYFMKVSPGAPRCNPYLKALIAVEERLLKEPQTGSDSNDCELGTPIDAIEDPCVTRKCTVQLCSLHYRCVPLTTTVEVFAVVRNPLPEAVFDLHLALFAAGADVTVSVTCSSGRVECLSPGQAVCVSALVRIPYSAYVTAGQGYLSLRVALCYRVVTDGRVKDEHSAEGSQEDATSLLSLRLLQGLATSRPAQRVVGVVHVDIIEAHANWRDAPDADDDASVTMKQLLRRQLLAKYNQRGEPLGVVAQTGAPLLVDSAGRPVPLCSYAPSLCVSISSPLARSAHIQRLLRDTASVITTRSVQDLHAALAEVRSSAFDMQAIVEALGSTLSEGGFRTSAVSIAGSGAERPRASATLSWVTHAPAQAAPSGSGGLTASELRRSLLSEVRREAVLQCEPSCAVDDPLTVLGNAVLLLRRLLPPEVTVTAHVSETDRRRAIRRACLCMLDEIAHVARANDTGTPGSGDRQVKQAPDSETAQPHHPSHRSGAFGTPAAVEGEEGTSKQPQLIEAEALRRQRWLTDLAIAAVFADLR